MKQARVHVSLGPRSYDVLIGENLADQVRAFVAGAGAAYLVSDSNVGPLYADAFSAAHTLSVSAGESSKSAAELQRLYDAVFATGDLDRRAVIIALGGGVVGDLAGYLAATLLRGIRYVQVPTSLLAMVDSSVGGKTAINHAAGKNLIGAFHQPAAVFCDVALLATLPEREYVSALAEVVKTAMVGDAALLDRIETGAAALLARDPETLAEVIHACISFKARIVAADELETSGQRAILNFGHTLGHALEAIYPGRYLHGEAVAIGICAALKLSEARSGLDAAVTARVIALLGRFGLPVQPPQDLDWAAALAYMAADKKRQGSVVAFVVTPEVGRAETLPCKLDDSLVRDLKHA
jgi:3-dehydroquinate synthase